MEKDLTRKIDTRNNYAYNKIVGFFHVIKGDIYA